METVSKKDRIITAVLNAKAQLDVKERDGKLFVNNLLFNTLGELDEYITHMENLGIFTAIADVLGLEYDYDGEHFKVSLK